MCPDNTTFTNCNARHYNNTFSNPCIFPDYYWCSEIRSINRRDPWISAILSITSMTIIRYIDMTCHQNIISYVNFFHSRYMYIIINLDIVTKYNLISIISTMRVTLRMYIERFNPTSHTCS